MLQNVETNLVTIFEREITFTEEISDEIKERLLVIAKKCPVSKILEHSTTINTEIK